MQNGKVLVLGLVLLGGAAAPPADAQSLVLGGTAALPADTQSLAPGGTAAPPADAPSLVLGGAAALPASAQSLAPGGFVESATSTDARPRIFPKLPWRGKFSFPAPYGTVGVRVTNRSDCGGADCVQYVGYSYWRNSNNHVGSGTMLLMVTLDRNRGGGGPTLFSYDKASDKVTKVGPLFDASSALSWSTGEGWYWSATRQNALYLNDGARMRRYDVVTRQFETVFDARGSSAPTGPSGRCTRATTTGCTRRPSSRASPGSRWAVSCIARTGARSRSSRGSASSTSARSTGAAAGW